MTYEDFLKEEIRDYMSNLFYLEGKDKDYFFGKSIWNDDLTLFYNDLDDRTSLLGTAAVAAEAIAARALKQEVGVSGNCKEETIDLYKSAFNVHAINYRYFDGRNGDFLFGINVMKTGELEQAIEKEQERWKFYLKHRDD